jgi:hypothetical protein
LRSNQLPRFFHEARISDHHIGVNLVSGGEMKKENGQIRIGLNFDSGGTETPAPKTDVVSACKQYLTELIKIVYECYEQFGHLIEPGQYYSEENFAHLGLTIEDAEEEVFGFRGWTSAPGVPIS